MFCPLISLPHLQNSIYNMTDNNSNTSSNNSEFETELPDFSTIKPFDMEPRKKVSIHITIVNPGMF